MSRTIKVSDRVYAKLEEVKRDNQHTSIDSVLRELLHHYENKRGR